MALTKLDKTSREFATMSHQDEEEWMVVLKDLIERVNTGFDKTNEHINKVASMQTEINTEKNKTGITQTQADAIVANTAKTGITTSQADAIVDNSKQAKSLVSDIATLNLGVQQNVQTNTKGVTATIIPTIVVGKKGSTLDLSIRMSDGSVYATSLNLTKLK